MLAPDTERGFARKQAIDLIGGQNVAPAPLVGARGSQVRGILELAHQRVVVTTGQHYGPSLTPNLTCA